MMEALRKPDPDMARLLGSRSALGPSLEDAAWLVGRAFDESADRGALALELAAARTSEPRQEVLDASLRHAWAASSSFEACPRLIAAGADPWLMVPDEGFPEWSSPEDVEREACEPEPEPDPEGSDEERWVKCLGCELAPVPLAVGMAQQGWGRQLQGLGVAFDGRDAQLAFMGGCAGMDAESLRALLGCGCHPSLFPDLAAAALSKMCRRGAGALDEPAREQQAQCVRILAGAGVPVDGLPGALGLTPLMSALKAGSTGLALELLDLGADPFIVRGRHDAPSLAALFTGDPEFQRDFGKAVAAKERDRVQGAVLGEPRRSAVRARWRASSDQKGFKDVDKIVVLAFFLFG